ncbi:C-GCAxxG-C-C family protein [uncultured Desulfobacter sp.]|uniref:C-GCAxxG-C-C family protein n=1 Tax=uncultured Desulfobacter sp. TaxID=240139 RepID=UPI002AA77C90|nr:C-GCAxxG-C-C family protein [uncultured Desulfobacter sp.]
MMLESEKKKINTATGNLKAGYSCSEAVLLTYGPQLGLDQKLAVKIASGFGGGMGGLGETCGAVSAAYMVIGLKYGGNNVKDNYPRESAYQAVTEFAHLFKKRHGSTYCRDLIGGIDMSTPEGRKQIRENGRVPEIVSDAIIILEKIFKGND